MFSKGIPFTAPLNVHLLIVHPFLPVGKDWRFGKRTWVSFLCR